MKKEVEKAIELTKEAIDLDNRKEYKRSLDMYIRALQQWSMICKCNFLDLLFFLGETDTNLRDKYFNKMKQYLERAENIKSYLNTTSSNQVPAKHKSDSTTTHDNEYFNEFESLINKNSNEIQWDDIVGHDGVKIILKESILLPMKFPKLFSNKNIINYNCILLYGPPGTGKTYLANALSNEFKYHFLSISSSNILSKYYGESERYIRNLFNFCILKSPCVLFIDEIDSICNTRNVNQHEATNRIKTEFMIQINRKMTASNVKLGLNNEGNVLLLGSTNLPWLLDNAIIRRFEKRIYIPLPNQNNRFDLIKKLFTNVKHTLTDSDFLYMAENTNNFNCYDINILVKEIVLYALKKYNNNESLLNISENDLIIPSINIEDAMEVLKDFRPSVVVDDIKLYEQWTQHHGTQL
ncbi:AAA family ATPase, putative [Theileria annulata]|uniref:AAA family ATPase, putative n=1 Tax=Theileria annulata TaxID=5874 RepID=Q4UC87_THEAN|nr:AAA family ATPase, putative [Theileria annulata]CAI75564.1 AAA family ATPase, putative [Theileria annulata]|eukprot:XP_955040.1 AAA family ATPase, putative [Theileria annulata]